MPRGDKTGPMGAGPQTGRAAGYCAGYSVPGYMNPVAGYGRGPRRGRGRGWGRGFGRAQFCYPQPVNVQPIVPQQTPEQEVTALENYQKQLEAEKNDLEQEMGGVKARILELKEKITEK
ncbi:MAG: DUF5320 domain-containing protein [Candidatus Bathyarchaeota archaeon]|nr:DUF5320 domain-containing protein [Candidatus Bathyarchaeota archaeon]